MEEKVGSFVIDEQGHLTPNMADEAMAKRQGQQAPENVNTEVTQ